MFIEKVEMDERIRGARGLSGWSFSCEALRELNDFDHIYDYISS